MSTIHLLLKEGQRSFPEGILLEDEASVSFDRSLMLRFARSLGKVLDEQGIRRGDRVAILLPDGARLCVAFLGVSCHCIAAPLNPAASLQDLLSWLEDLQPRAVLVGEGSPSTALDAADRLGLPLIRFEDIAANANDTAPSFDPEPRPEDVALILHTSGTTAKAKMVPLTHGNLMRSASNIAESLRLGPDDLCMNVMPMFHIHGIVACLLAPLVSGGKVLVSEGIDATRFFQLLIEKKVTWYSAVPTRHKNLLDHLKAHPGLYDGHKLRLIRSSSSALPVAVFEALESAFGVPVIEAYGMTEAAHQMCSNPLPPAVRKPGSVGLPAGPQVRVVDGMGKEVVYGEVGEVVIRGDNVTPGYINLPDDRQERLEGGWFRTGDLGQMDADGYLFLHGRVKEIVNRGGEKVSPAEVDACLLRHEAVAEAACFAVPHPSLGEDLAAAVVLHKGFDSDEQSLRAYLFDRLSHFKIPSRILVVDSIPKSSIGKVQRRQLADRLKHLLQMGFEKPTDETERFLAEVFRDAIPGCMEVGRASNFFGLGGDSLQAIRAAQRISSRYGIELPAHEVFRHPTPETLGARISALRKEMLVKSLEKRLASLPQERIDALLRRGGSADSREN
jgi:acyl-CoA synthetase (AMP-forming)/AMP-acid ligase II/acyl carrier protein